MQFVVTTINPAVHRE